jgi:hypothetical protein
LTRSASQTEESQGETVRWNAHPARRRPGTTAAAAAVIALLALCAGWLGGSSWWAVASAFILMVALNRFFFPSEFSIDDEGIAARYPLRRQRLLWKDVRRFLHDERGGYLSTRVRASRFDAYRGMHLLFEGDSRERIIELIESKARSIRGLLEDSRHGGQASSPASAGGGL